MYTGRKLVWSNVAWLLPAVYATSYQLWWLVLPAVIVMLLSMAFHSTGNKIIEVIDTVFACVYAGVYGPILILGTDYIRAPIWLGLMVFVSIGVALRLWYRARLYDSAGDVVRYQNTHVGWQVMAALMTLAIYYGYLTFPNLTVS